MFKINRFFYYFKVPESDFNELLTFASILR